MTLRDALVAQATHCAALGSPFMARLLPILAEVWPHGSELDADILAYDGDIGPKGHSLPLRLASGLHALVLTGQDPALTAAYPPNQVSDAALRDVVSQALTTQSDFLRDWITSPPQTNEVRRSAALIAVRPSRLVIDAGEGVPATVAKATYVGVRMEYTLTGHFGQVFAVHDNVDSPLDPGTEVRMGFATKGPVLLPE